MIRLLVTGFFMSWAVWTDLNTGRVPNRLNGLLMSSALVYRMLAGIGNWDDVLRAFVLLALCLGPLWFMDMLGAGDIKFLAGMGGFWGTEGVIWMTIYSIPCALVLFTGLSVWRRKWVLLFPGMPAFAGGYLWWVMYGAL